MAKNAGFWGWYAEANDSARTELIDKAWFGQNHAETPMQDALKDPDQKGEMAQITAPQQEQEQEL